MPTPPDDAHEHDPRYNRLVDMITDGVHTTVESLHQAALEELMALTHAPVPYAESLNQTLCGDWAPGDRVLGLALPGVTEISCPRCFDLINPAERG